MEIKTHEVLIIAKNTTGIAARILLLFSRRGYMVEKMTAGDTNIPGYTRLTLTVKGDEEILDQIQKQVYKLIEVSKVSVFPVEDVMRRELMLIKVKANAQNRAQIAQVADIYRGNVIDVGINSMAIEMTGDVKKLEGFVDIMQTYGILEIAKTGVVAMRRGEKM